MDERGRSAGGVPEKERPWRPLSAREAAKLFDGAPFPWWIAGGLAIEFAAGRALRAHADIDVLVLHRDARRVREWLCDWDCWMADPPGTLRPWPTEEKLPEAAHDVWCREEVDGEWRLQLMFDGSQEDTWQSRRNARIARPLNRLGIVDDTGIPYLAPDIVLYYKAKSPRPRDEIDFEAMLPLLTTPQRDWLAGAIAATYGYPNRWIDLLRKV